MARATQCPDVEQDTLLWVFTGDPDLADTPPSPASAACRAGAESVRGMAELGARAGLFLRQPDGQPSCSAMSTRARTPSGGQSDASGGVMPMTVATCTTLGLDLVRAASHGTSAWNALIPHLEEFSRCRNPGRRGTGPGGVASRREVTFVEFDVALTFPAAQLSVVLVLRLQHRAGPALAREAAGR